MKRRKKLQLKSPGILLTPRPKSVQGTIPLICRTDLGVASVSRLVPEKILTTNRRQRNANEAYPEYRWIIARSAKIPTIRRTSKYVSWQEIDGR